MGVLDGYRIIDMTTVVLGPYATQMLGDMGADVIKVEAPEGDIMRHAGAMRSPGMGPIFLATNRNKRSVVLDLKQESARQILGGLIAKADLFIHNVREGGIGRLGFDYPSVREINPNIVYVHAVGFSSKGRYRGRPAYDDLVQAASGLASMLPRQDGSDVPRYFPGLLADKTAGLFCANAALAGLLHRERTGEGQFIEVPMLESMVSFNMVENLYGHAFHPPMGQTGYVRTMSAWRKPYATKDGFLAVLPYSDANWRAFFAIGGEAELAEDPRFSTYKARTENIDAIYREAERLAAKLTTQEWLARLEEANVPAAPVHTLESVLDDPHLRETGFVSQIDHPSEGALLSLGQPLSFSAGGDVAARPAPRLGEHNGEVFAEFGIDDGLVAALKGGAQTRMADG